ncbi:MAG: thiosulfate oxidation carrier protein SoxY [Proteobacteria bacterium]|nr:thiosulfate oxidation carrier protein SoxY [Pseudomonadota bacterium]
MTILSAAQSRRSFLQVASLGLLALAGSRSAFASAADVEALIQKYAGGKTPKEGRITLDLPSIAENGLVVPLNFEVESPMTETDYVKSVHLFAEGNPSVQVADFNYTPLAPKAAAKIRIRLAQTQNVTALAVMSTGDTYIARKEVKVTIGGCGG